MQAAPADASGPVIHQHGFEITAFRLLPIKNLVQVTVLRRPGRFVGHIEEVLAWYRITPYQKPEDWVFASDSPRAGAKRGKQPYWPMTIMRMFIKPVAKRLGIGNISWHTFRHTYSNLLHANREDPKVVQELLRHSSIQVTMDVYTQVVTSEKRKAQSRVVELIAPRPRPEAGNAHHLS
jgi:Phage integrase family